MSSGIDLGQCVALFTL